MTLTPDQFKAWREQQRTSGRYKLKPIPGLVSNPLRNYPRNSPCLCGSGDKWKHCCLATQPLFIPKEDLEDHRAVLRGEDVNLG